MIGLDTSTGRVERQFSDRNTYPVGTCNQPTNEQITTKLCADIRSRIHPLISETQDPLPVGEHDGFDDLVRVVIQYLAHMAYIVQTDIDTTKNVLVYSGPLLAGLSNGWSVHDRLQNTTILRL